MEEVAGTETWALTLKLGDEVVVRERSHWHGTKHYICKISKITPKRLKVELWNGVRVFNKCNCTQHGRGFLTLCPITDEIRDAIRREKLVTFLEVTFSTGAFGEYASLEELEQLKEIFKRFIERKRALDK